MNHPRLHLMLALVSCGLLAGCGGNGGQGAADGGAPPTGAIPAQRAVPGYAIGVERRTAIIPGGSCTVRLAVSPEEGQATITGIEVWLGADAYAVPPSTTRAFPVTGTGSTWEVSTVLPDPLPADATVWLRLTAADGSVMEIGRDAFRLSELPGG